MHLVSPAAFCSSQCSSDCILCPTQVQDLPAELLVNTPASGAVPAPAHDPPRAPAAASPSPGTAILRRPDSTGFTVQVHVGGETVELDLVHAVAELAAVLRRCPQLVSLFRPRSQPAGAPSCLQCIVAGFVQSCVESALLSRAGVCQYLGLLTTNITTCSNVIIQPLCASI